MNGEPALFLNGIFQVDMNNIVPLGTKNIKKIECLNEERAFGELSFDGILSIVSKNMQERCL